ncbi:flagellar biosynthesis protein FlgN [Phaeobacter gallaeciensis]|uniref:Flagellar biosynthesis protein FlgN n=2 Tax=Roseobacteraceae TaxID=2854170 RepID=A0A366X5J7_9RHOB|nr:MULTISPECIES: flagellar biosynthesis protein FlgN [Roseobacteraceae]MBT3141943.1 flagellar biosynthesis protein FlgN [Falsiruegeria litorea]MBT8168710.1 flagellar biosynthesis protein FlgN [Falsiruegeria litorea]RBW60028.1 flagellar biosynthesis protein FlgN [Phaeobacter gallaeciensis]
MTNETANELMISLDELLDRERSALIAGELNQLPQVMVEKEKLIEKLNELDAIDRDRLGPIQEKVSRNQQLLGSALEGIKAVSERMAELRRVRRGLETYDQSGRKTKINLQLNTRLEKRS